MYWGTRKRCGQEVNILILFRYTSCFTCVSSILCLCEADVIMVVHLFEQAQEGGEVRRGDIIKKIADYDARDLRHEDAQNLFRNAGNAISLVVQRYGMSPTSWAFALNAIVVLPSASIRMSGQYRNHDSHLRCHFSASAVSLRNTQVTYASDRLWGLPGLPANGYRG
jgi:hypothetical protein